MRLFGISCGKLIEICFNNSVRKQTNYYLKETFEISALKEGGSGKHIKTCPSD